MTKLEAFEIAINALTYLAIMAKGIPEDAQKKATEAADIIQQFIYEENATGAIDSKSNTR